MERDFMGLNLKESVIMIKEEASEGCKDSPGFFKCPQAQWPLTNAFNPSNKFQSGENQRNFNQNREGRAYFSMTNYPVQQIAHPVHLPSHDLKAAGGMNQGISLSMNSSFLKTQFAGQNFTTASTKPRYLGGVPVTAPHSNPSFASQAVTNEQRAPAQMTIFYGGTVNVFDDISPEKAQAIMFLAGNAPSAAYNVAQPKHHQLASSPKPVAEDIGFRGQLMNSSPCSALSSPISVGGSTNNDGPTKINGGASTPVNGTTKIVTSAGHVAAPTMMQSAVPQARKASLARFLEKRKERTMSSAPYNTFSKNTTESLTPGSNAAYTSESSGLVAAPVSTSKGRSN
ncbi:hypothetical protein AgCh_019844 [Apium graveolens]